jgi:hypothetical protein
MNAGFESLVRYLEENRWKFERHDIERSINLGFAGQNACYRCLAVVDADDDLFQFFSFIPMRVPEEKRHSVAELITRANYGLKIGKFELDYSDGELRFQTSARYGENILHSEVIRDIIATNLLTVDRYFPAFANVLFAGDEPAEAIEKIERPGTNRSRWDFAG